jgi:hypothetical protein
MDEKIHVEQRNRRLRFCGYQQDEKEVDFVGIKSDRRVYVQVAYSIGKETTAKREYSSLEAINDSYENFLLCPASLISRSICLLNE